MRSNVNSISAFPGHGGNWGVMIHFLSSHAGKVDYPSSKRKDWEMRVDGVDVDRLVGDVADAGAGHLIFTVGQNTGYYCSPNDVFEEALGCPRGTYCTKRDLIKDMAHACRKRNVRFIAYSTCHPPIGLRESSHVFGPFPHDGGKRWGMSKSLLESTPRSEDASMQLLRSKWFPVLRNWAENWGALIDGWWIDGGYYRDMFQSSEGLSLPEILRAGNPQAAIAVAKGHRTSLEDLYSFEDYTAGEFIERPWFGGWFGSKDFQLLPAQIGKARVHLLSFLGEYWGRGERKLPADLALAYTRFVVGQGALMTWDIPILPEGNIPSDIRQVLNMLADLSE